MSNNKVVGVGKVRIKDECVTIQGVLLPFTERTQPAVGSYAEVQLFKSRGKWWLHYSNTICTGAFRTRKEAAQWFNSGGR